MDCNGVQMTIHKRKPDQIAGAPSDQCLIPEGRGLTLPMSTTRETPSASSFDYERLLLRNVKLAAIAGSVIAALALVCVAQMALIGFHALNFGF